MAAIVKHVGRCGDRKLAVVFREIPGEPHMALVVWTETLNRYLHDAIMECINSDGGQSAENLADALNRTYTRDGKLVLQQLHTEGMLKKVQCDQIIMTPTPSNKHDVKLSDLNSIINKMNAGEEAVRELEELDRSRGLQDPVDVARRMRESKKTAPQTSQPQPQSQSQSTAPAKSYRSDDMSDAAIAWRLRQQADRMAAEGRGLLAESERMLSEAAQLDPPAPPAPTKKTRVKKTAEPLLELQPVVAPQSSQPAKRGRKSASVAL